MGFRCFSGNRKSSTNLTLERKTMKKTLSEEDRQYFLGYFEDLFDELYDHSTVNVTLFEENLEKLKN
jgi:hypothetical protein